MIGTNIVENPYFINGPVSDPRMIVGRDGVMRWLAAYLEEVQERKPLIIWSDRGLGKSTVLGQLSQDDFGEGRVLVRFDAEALQTENTSEFCWLLTKLVSKSLTAVDRALPRVEKPRFLIQPERVFMRDYWYPILDDAAPPSFIFVIDNYQQLIRDLSSEDEHARRRRLVWDEIISGDKVRLIFSLIGRPELYRTESFGPLDISLSYQLHKLNFDDTCRLLNIPDQYQVPEHVCNYIFALTSGHPADVQRIGYALYDRMTELSLGTATLADVLVILSEDYQPSDFYGSVYQNRESTSMVYSSSAGIFEFVNDSQPT